MRSGLFWRTFSAVMAVVLVTVALFSTILMTIQTSQAQETYELEVRMQARQVASYMEQLNKLEGVRSNSTIQRLVNEKIGELYARYSADIWLVTYNLHSATIQYVDSTWNTSEGIATEAVSRQLDAIQSGSEIRVAGLFPELGDHIVTIGVPWTYSDGFGGEYVVGAVLLHIPIDALRVSIWDTLPMALMPASVSLMLGVLLSFFVARSQTHPIREIESAVRSFSRGDLSRRVNLHCGGELEQLGNAINRMAGELSQMEDSRRSFVANVSHELRSPMTSMKGYVEAMLDGTIPEQDRPRYLQVVLDETNRLTDLVRDLLDLSRLESGKFPMHTAPFDANELMRRNLIRFDGRIDEKHIDVVMRFAEDPCYALGDVSRINQVITNFIDNAVKFMTGEGSILTLETRREGGFIRFTVQDNGPGISEEDLPRILERFYKADKAHTAGMGTGLGLSICKNILQQHDSLIDIASRPGETSFSFLLPVAEPEQRRIEGGR